MELSTISKHADFRHCRHPVRFCLGVGGFDWTFLLYLCRSSTFREAWHLWLSGVQKSIVQTVRDFFWIEPSRTLPLQLVKILASLVLPVSKRIFYHSLLSTFMMASYSGTAPPDGDRNRAAELIAVGWSQCAVSIIFVALRFYSRTRLTGNLWLDDVFIFITLASVKLCAEWMMWTKSSGIVDFPHSCGDFLDHTCVE